MAQKSKSQITDALVASQQAKAASGRSPSADTLLPDIYGELRALAAHYLKAERPGHTIQATALVNEAYLRLVDQSRVEWKGKTHFFSVAAMAMRRILVDHARARLRDKREGGLQRVTFVDDLFGDGVGEVAFEDILALDEALTQLAALDERQALLVEHRFFGGMSVTEAAAELGIPKRTAEADWTHAKAWLRRALTEQKTT